jgi:NAD(P)-dependent dehydrogenase (short-subunit alcohol dehydrogenase family)
MWPRGLGPGRTVRWGKPMNEAPVAFVTGASRGIGKAIAVHLAAAGYDVAIGARTQHEGEEREHSSTVATSNTRALPGSLDSTGALIERAGSHALPVYLDLLDRTSLGSAVGVVLERLGRIDVLVNNGRYVGPGHMDQILDTPIELLDRHLEANVMAPVILAKLVLPQMIELGSGVLINLASSSGAMDPPSPAGHGGWGLGYGMSKGALHRMAGIVAVELADRGIRAYNLSPGFIATERIAIDMAEFGFDASAGAPPDVVGAVAAWLVTAPEARERTGQWIEAQVLCRELGLLPDWP